MERADHRTSGLGVARAYAAAALIVGGLFAAVSVYWGFGGLWLLDTVGGTLAAQGRARGEGAVLAVWAAVGLKLVASLLPLAAVTASPSPRWRRPVRVLTWVEAVILLSYGGLLTVVGLLVQAGVIRADADADHQALRWHAYLWDPWFLVWGVLVALALLTSRDRRSSHQG